MNKTVISALERVLAGYLAQRDCLERDLTSATERLEEINRKLRECREIVADLESGLAAPAAVA